MWIEVKGRQHRVYWRTGLPKRSKQKDYEKFATREDAKGFIDFARWVGLQAARDYLTGPTPQAFAALTAVATGAAAPGGLTVALPDGPLGPVGPTGAGSDQHLVGVTFEPLWERFMQAQRHNEEGTVELYTGYTKYHLLPFFGSSDLGLIARTRPLRCASNPRKSCRCEMAERCADNVSSRHRRPSRR